MEVLTLESWIKDLYWHAAGRGAWHVEIQQDMPILVLEPCNVTDATKRFAVRGDTVAVDACLCGENPCGI